MSKILYLSCHSILEFDEIKLLSQLGHEVFSPGAYVEPRNPGDATLRPSVDFDYDPDVVAQWHKLASNYPDKDTKDYLTKEFVDNFDTVIVMHLPRWIQRNWDAMKHKRVVWRTIGQSIQPVEQSLRRFRDEGMEIVRYSPMERNIPGYIGEDALIRFYKDEAVYSGWTGEQERVISFAQSMKQRDQACNYTFFEETTRDFPRHLFGPGNEGQSWTSGKVSYVQQLIEYRTNRCYFYTGTHPASYTLNFIEAAMTGIPMVCIGNEHGNASYFQNHNLYEIPNIIKHGENGFISDNPTELQHCIRELLGNYDYAQKISEAGRQTAIELFGVNKIKNQWKAYLGK